MKDQCKLDEGIFYWSAQKATFISVKLIDLLKKISAVWFYMTSHTIKILFECTDFNKQCHTERCLMQLLTAKNKSTYITMPINHNFTL